MLLILFLILSFLGGGAVCFLSEKPYLHFLWLWPVSGLGIFLALVLLAFLFLLICCKLVDKSKPQLHDDKFYRGMIALYVRSAMPLLRVHYEKQGIENIPKSGRFLLISNHLSDMDPVCLLDTFPKSELAFISKRENSDMFIVGDIMHKLMCQLINRENDREALKTILKCIQLIKDDEVNIAVFPEGYIRGTGKLEHFRSGVFKIALKTKVPIVVCTLAGTEDVFHNAARLKKTTVKVHLLEVIPPEFYADMTAVDIGNYCYNRMLADLGEKYAPISE